MITLDLDFYWLSVGLICTVLSSFWGFRRIKSLFGR